MAGMKLGIFGLNMKAAIEPADTARLARRCEALGYESWWAGEHVVLPSPRVPPAPRPEEWMEMLKGDIAHLLRYTAEFNLIGMPTLTMNGGFDKRGVPIGFQLVGKHLSEDLLLRAGYSFQSITDWHARHPPLD